MGDHFGTIRHISINIEGTTPKILWYIALVIIYKPTRFWVQNHQGTESVGKKVLEIPKKVMKSCPSEAPGRALARTGAERGRITIEPQNHRTTGP